MTQQYFDYILQSEKELMERLLLFLLLWISFTPNGQGQDYTNKADSILKEDFKVYRTIAVLPFRVEVTLRPRVEKKMSPDQKALREYSLGYEVQAVIIEIFGRKQEKKSALFSIQDNTLTNELLKNAGINQFNYTDYTPNEIGQMLMVDAVMGGNLKTWKPISSGWAFLSNISNLLNDDDCPDDNVPSLFGDIEIYLVNTIDESVLWKYKGLHSIESAYGEGELIRKAIRKTVKYFPYFK